MKETDLLAVIHIYLGHERTWSPLLAHRSSDPWEGLKNSLRDTKLWRLAQFDTADLKEKLAAQCEVAAAIFDRVKKRCELQSHLQK